MAVAERPPRQAEPREWRCRYCRKGNRPAPLLALGDVQPGSFLEIKCRQCGRWNPISDQHR